MTDDLGRLVVEASLLALSARERAPFREVAERLRAGDARLHAEYRLALAWAVHHHLRRDHPGIEDVYVVGSSLEERARRSSDLDLVVVGGPFTAEDEDAFCEANRSISASYRSLVGGLGEDFELLDLHIVDRDDDAHPYRGALRRSDMPHYRLTL